MKMVHDHLYLHTLRARPAVKALQTIKDANVKRSVNWWDVPLVLLLPLFLRVLLLLLLLPCLGVLETLLCQLYVLPPHRCCHLKPFLIYQSFWMLADRLCVDWGVDSAEMFLPRLCSSSAHRCSHS
jgi:hypothetical protein